MRKVSENGDCFQSWKLRFCGRKRCCSRCLRSIHPSEVFPFFPAPPSQALVTLTDTVTKRRKDYWLGEYGTTASREMYHRVIAAWEACGRRFPCIEPDHPSNNADGLRIKEVLGEYWLWAKSHYSTKHLGALKTVFRLLRRFYGTTGANEFGPNKLRVLREEMIRGDAESNPPRRAWSRDNINMAVHRIRHVFKWAAAREMVPASVHQGLCTLEPLRRGSQGVRESAKVGPVPQHLLDATLPRLNRHVRAVVDLQLLTGARPGELLGLRPIDIEIDEEAGIWTCRPEAHKNAHREQERVIYFGPRAQAVLRPFLTGRPTNAFMFNPAEADAVRREALHAQRATPLSCGNRPGTNRSEAPRRRPGDRYTTTAYHRTIQRACDRAFPPTGKLGRSNGETKETWLARLRESGLHEDLGAWRKAHRWHPYQLRHNAATLLRREFGLEAAQLTLGHASAQITDAVYAERDEAKVVEIMRRIG